MARAPRSFLLEQLRAQADAVAAKRVQQLKLSREVVDRIDQRMHAVFQYFDEACKLLQVISPPIERSFVLPHIVRYEGLHLDKASVMFRKQRVLDRDVYDYVVVYYSLAGPALLPLRVAIRRSPEVERALVSANIEFTPTPIRPCRAARPTT